MSEGTEGKLARAAAAVDKIYKAAVKLARPPVILLLLTLGAALTWSQVRHEVVTVESFEGPEELAKRGWNGKALASLLIDQLARIRDEAETAYFKDRQFSAAWHPQELDVQVESVGFSSRAISDTLRGVLGRNRRISGELLLEGTGVILRVREAGSLARCYRADPGTPAGGAPADDSGDCLRVVPRGVGVATHEALLQDLLARAAEDLYLILDPVIAAAYHMKKNPERCREAIRFALTNADKEDDAWAYNLRGLLLQKEGHRREALREFRRALKADRRLVQAYNNRAVVLISCCERFNDKARRASCLKKPLSLLSRGLAVEPGSPELSSNLGRLLCALGRCRESLRHHEHAARRAPGNSNIQFNRAVALNADKRYEEADEAFDRVQLLAPDDLEVRFEWANELNQTGQYDRADQAFEQAQRLASPEAKRLIGWAVLLYGRNREADNDKARKKLLLAAKLAPKLTEPYQLVGDLLRDREADTAAKLFIRCKTLSQDAPSACWCSLNWALQALGRIDEAEVASGLCR